MGVEAESDVGDGVGGGVGVEVEEDFFGLGAESHSVCSRVP